MMMRKRILPLGMAVFLLLAACAAAFSPVWAIAEGAPVPTEVPMESVSPYRIILTAPGGWTSGNGAVMKVSVTDKDRLGWQKIEYRMNDGNWVDCENLFADGRAELTLHENGTFTLRVTDPHGHTFEESAEVKCIDLTAPVLTASINGTTLQVDAKDDLSGVAGVQVNSMLFTTLTKGTGAATAAQSGSEPFIADEPSQENTFNVYDDIREKLIAHGVPAEQIAFIHEANTEVKKKELFAKVRSGQVRVLMGSTAKMGAGTNVQDRLIALHDLDCPWRPGDLEQRAGRIVRQGNMNPEVSIFRYVTEATFDAYLWQTVENKQKFISQIMTSKSPVRSCEDMDETALSYAEIKALCAGDPRIKEKMDLDVDVARLKLMKADHQSKQFRLEDQLLKYFPQEVERDTQLIAGFQKDIATIEAHPLPQEDFVGMVVGDKLITDKEEAGKAILAACKDAAKGAPVEFGSYRGLPMRVQFDAFINKFVLTLHGAVSHPMEVGNDARGNITRLDNALLQIPKRLAATTEHLATVRQQIEAARAEAGKPFPQEAELRTKSARLAELDAALNMDRSSGARQKDILHSDNER